MAHDSQPHRSIKVGGDDWTVPNLEGPGRRTIVKGAAWTIPVVAVAVATPAAAASNTPTLVFTNGPYSANGCATLGPVVLQLTTDGQTVDPGKVVTVTLPDGLTWSDGTTAPRPFTTVADGTITLTGLKAPATGGSFTIAASSATGPTATSSVSVTASDVLASFYNNSGVVKTYSLPAGSTPVGAVYALTPNGDLYYDGAFVRGGVASASSTNNGQRNFAGVILDDGTHVLYNGATATPNTDFATPVGSEAIGSVYALAPNGDLYYNGAVVQSGVASAYGTNNDVVNFAGVVLTTGEAFYFNAGTAVKKSPTTFVPVGSQAIGAAYQLAPNGDLYYDGGSTPVQTGVVSADGANNFAANFAGVVLSNGTHILFNGGTATSPSANPAGSEAVGAVYSLAPNGDLFFSDGTKIGTGIAQAGATNNGGANFALAIAEPAC